MSQFDSVLNDSAQVVLTSSFAAKIVSVTLIRDLWGKIRLVISVEHKDNLPNKTSRNQLAANFAAQLGAYWGKAIWFVEDKKDTAFQAAQAQIVAQREAWMPSGYTGSIQWYKLERRYSKSSWLQNQLQPAWVLDATNHPDETAIVSFYSFKGGVGRSTALAAVALLLAKAEKPKKVYVVDLDLESPGIGTFLQDSNGPEQGVLDYLIEAQVTNTRPNLSNYLYIMPNVTEFRVMGAGLLNINYIEKLARLDFDSYSRDNINDHSLKKLLEHIRDEYHPDFILLDIRAGFHDIGGLSINGLSHLDVIFARNDAQSKAGLQTLMELMGPESTERNVFLVHAQIPQPNDSAKLYDEDLHLAFRTHAFNLFGQFYYGAQTTQPDIAETETPYGIPIPFEPALQRVANLTELETYARNKDNGFIGLARLIGTYLAKETI